MPASFAIVDFILTKEVEVVPISWIRAKGMKCLWPPLKPAEAEKLAKKACEPEKDWQLHSSRILQTYSTYDEARLHINSAADNSDLGSDADKRGKGKRNKRVTQRLCFESGDEDQLLEAQHDNSLNFSEVSGIAVPILTEEILKNYPQAVLQEVSLTLDSAEPVIEETQLEEAPSVETVSDSAEPLSDSHTMSSNKADIPTEHDFPIRLLPIKSLPEVFNVENLIREEKVAASLTNLLAFGGGSTVDATVKRIMRKLFDDEVAQHFSWKGAKGKVVFSNLKMVHVIFDAVRKNTLIPEVLLTEATMEISIKNWLRHAKARFINAAASSSKAAQSESLL